MKAPIHATIYACLAALTLSACSSLPKPAYVSPNNYQSYQCAQLASEYTRVNQYIDASANQRTGLQASGISIGVTGGRGGIYPTVSVGLGSVNGGNRHNLSTAMGQREAMIQAARQKQCAFVDGIKLYNEK